jgi:hypothetical protein
MIYRRRGQGLYRYRRADDLCLRRPIPERLQASFFRVIIAFDQMRPASLAFGGFQAPLDQFADIALALKKVEDVWRARAAAYLERKARSTPEMNLEIVWQEHELGNYPTIGLVWSASSRSTKR